MYEWINNPVVVMAALGIVGLVFAIGRWVGHVNSDRTSFKEFMNEIRIDIKEIRASITGIFMRLPSSPIAGGSPLRLTELGRSISAALNGRAWAERTASDLAERVKDRQPYEIQDICFHYVKNEFKPADEQDAQIRACAYENSLSRDQVLDVLAVELRDRFLAQGTDEGERHESHA